jgi:hypothetical protein
MDREHAVLVNNVAECLDYGMDPKDCAKELRLIAAKMGYGTADQPDAVHPLNQWAGPFRHCGGSVSIGMCRACGVSQHSLDCAASVGGACDCMPADQQSARKGLDELTRMAQEDGLYDGPADKTGEAL